MKNLVLFLLLMTTYTLSVAGPYDELIKQINNNPTYHATVLNTLQKKEIEKAYLDYFSLAFGERDEKKKELPGYRPDQLYPLHFKLIQSIYLEGYIQDSSLDKWKNEYKKLNSKNTVFDAANEKPEDYKARWLAEHKKVLEAFFEHMENEPISCASEGEDVYNKKCCPKHIKASFQFASNNNRCVKQEMACRKNSECCSGMCEKDSPDAMGKCLAQSTCLEIHELGDSCGLNSPVCHKGSCQNILKVDEKTGKNKSQKQCSNCISEGGEVQSDRQCCPGLLKLNNKCVVPFPKLVPTVEYKSIPKKYHLFSKLFNLLFPSAMAQNSDPKFISKIKAQEDKNKDKNLTQAQHELIEEKTRECNAKNRKGSVGLTNCLKAVERQKTKFVEDSFTQLSQAQMDEIESKNIECAQNHKTGTQEHKECIDKVASLEKELRSKNMEAGKECLEKHEAGSQEYKECMVAKEAYAKDLNIKQYLDKYSIPAITAKTYSDLKRCEFNSFNDSWRDAANREQNAEIFLRGFEFVFSHQGTQDYWFEKNKGNIFTRANKVAVEFRKNRTIMLEHMAEIDRKMACKCIAIFGPANFNTEKQKFFNSHCEVEKSELRVELGADLGKKRSGESNDVSKIDGTSIQTINSKQDKFKVQEGAIEEVDKGATGISHERLLIEWLNLRAEAQIKRFTDNSKLEKELAELSEFIGTVNFSEVYKDRMEGNIIIRGTPPKTGDTVLLYKWGYDYPPGWLAIVGLILIVVGFMIAPFSLALPTMANLGSTIAGAILKNIGFSLLLAGGSGGGAANLKHGNVLYSMDTAWRYMESDKIDAKPEIKDAKVVSKKCIKRILGVCILYMDGFDRYFIGPNYVHPVEKADFPTCKVRGRASACFKNGYRVDFGEEIKFIVDPTRPLFVPEQTVALDRMHGHNLPFNIMVNNARDKGIKYLKSKKPGGSLPGGFANGGKSFQKNDHIGEAISKGYFLPLMGTLEDVYFEDAEDVNGKEIIMSAAKKYALCKNLTQCGAEGLEDDLTGFGYLFESTSEAEKFSEYAYEIHYKWSHITKEYFMGYPLATLDQYFQMVAFNMKLVGSYSSSRAMKFHEAANLYQQDFNNRLSDYNSLGTATIGLKSRNLTLSKAFYNQFAKLNLDGETNIEKFDASMLTAQKTKNFNKAEISALNAGRSSAIRRNDDIKAKEAFDEAMANASPETQKILIKNNKFIKNKVNTPLSQFALTKFGDGANKNNKLDSELNNNMVSNVDNNDPLGVNNFWKTEDNNSIPYASSFNGASDGSDSEKIMNENNKQITAKQMDDILESVKKMKRKLEPDEADTLFTKISKAYKRSYGRLLSRPKGPKASNLVPVKEYNISDQQKNRLRSILKKDSAKQAYPQ